MSNHNSLSADERREILLELRKHINDHEFERACKLADKYSDVMLYPLIDDDSEEFFGQLTALRITAATMLGRQDLMIRHIARVERYNLKQSIPIDTNHEIRVISKSITMFKTDAIINSVHKTNFFDYSSQSISKQFLNILGQSEIQRQLEAQMDDARLFYILHHPGMFKAEYSYHIPAYFDDNQLDLESLKDGYQAVLQHIATLHYKDIAVAPIGLSANNEKYEKEQTIEATAKVLIDFLYENPNLPFPKVFFPCTDQDTFHTTIRMLKRATPEGYFKNIAARALKENEKKLIQAVSTSDFTYSIALKRLSSHLDDEVIILLLGETGTGKSHVAKAFHMASGREHSGSFYQLNCGALTPSIQMSEIFGVIKGAFTGASTDIESIFDKAGKGTVLIDEIGYANLEVQAALLTMIDNRTYRKVGKRKEDTVLSRLIFGTNADLKQLVREQRFLPDLYERISNSATITIPPLRKRLDDINRCLDDWLIGFNKIRAQQGLTLHRGFTSDALDLLRRYTWPGNVRQLLYYSEMLMYETLANNIDVIDEKIILNNPPRNYRLVADDPMSHYQGMTEELVDEWVTAYEKGDSSSRGYGPFIGEVVEPIVAHLFYSKYEGRIDKRDTKKVLGLDGGGVGRKLDKAFEKWKFLANRHVRDGKS
jgi:DNA-binding NtrC family response regulator